MDDLRRLPGMTPPQLRRHGRAILRRCSAGWTVSRCYPPKPVRPDERYLLRLDALRTWRKQVANSMGVESDVVLPKDLMQALAEKDTRKPGAIAEVLAATPYRLERFGPQLEKLLTKK